MPGQRLLICGPSRYLDLTQRNPQCTIYKECLQGLRLHINNLHPLTILATLPSHKLRQANTPAMPLTSSANTLSMGNTHHPSRLNLQASTPLVRPIKPLVLTPQINNLIISSSKCTVRTNLINPELCLH